MISPQDAITAIKQRFGQHAGFRALHAKGLFCSGSFTATAEAAALTKALPYQGETLRATVRFSNGGGDPTIADYMPDVRGLAVSIHLPDGKRTDIVAQSAPRFPVRDADGFIAFMRAMQPGLAQAWKLPDFLRKHPGALGAMLASSSALINPPASYASIPYFAVHGFLWTAADGSQRWVRYRWVPQQEQRLSILTAKKQGANYLQEGLRTHIQQGGSIRMALHVQIADAGDDPHDPMSVWAGQQDVVVGHLEVTALLPEREADGKVFVFDPVRVVEGIGLSDDPILNYRPRAYSESAKQRAGIKASSL